MQIVVQTFSSSACRSNYSRKIMYQHIEEALNSDRKVIVLVEGMGHFDDPYTNETLEALIPNDKLTMEEQFSLHSIPGILSMLTCKSELHLLGYKVTSCSLSSLGITASTIDHKEIPTLDSSPLKLALQEFDIVICPGYKDSVSKITIGNHTQLLATLIGAQLKAEEITLFSDIKGIYTCDPRLIENVKKLSTINYLELLELTQSGANIINPHCLQVAAKHNITLHVKSTFDHNIGTYIIGENDKMKKEYPFVVSAITGSQNEARITIVNASSANNVIGQLCKAISNAGINIHVFNQVLVGGGKMDISFIIDEEDVNKTIAIINDMKSTLSPYRTIIRSNIGKVSVVGAGIKNNQGLFQSVYNTLVEEDISVEMTSSSEITISCYINRNKVNQAKAILHKLFFETGGKIDEKI